MNLEVSDTGWLRLAGRRFRCALGAGGVVRNKTEGDGATPAGAHPIRRLFYRPDRLARPSTALPVTTLKSRHGWSDDPADPAYNCLVHRPHPYRHEALWRDDGLYDLIAVLGWNDAPAEPGRGSAIFLHVAAPDFAPTRGCVALARHDLLTVLAEAGPGDRLVVRDG